MHIRLMSAKAKKGICERLTNLSDEDLECEIKSLIKITYVGHSMGGMTLPMYVINARAHNKPHYLADAILMSPAGFHSQDRLPPLMHYIGTFFYHVVPLFFDHIALPDSMIGLITKLQQDIISWSATRRLCQYMGSKMFGGSGDFIKSARMVQSMLQFGFSTDLARQFF